MRLVDSVFGREAQSPCLSGCSLLEKEEEVGGCRKCSPASAEGFYVLRQRRRRPHSTHPASFLAQASSSRWLDEKDRTCGCPWLVLERRRSLHAQNYCHFRERRKTQCVEGSVLQSRAEGFIVEPLVVRSYVLLVDFLFVRS